jgi:hypothetical protein
MLVSSGVNSTEQEVTFPFFANKQLGEEKVPEMSLAKVAPPVSGPESCEVTAAVHNVVTPICKVEGKQDTFVSLAKSDAFSFGVRDVDVADSVEVLRKKLVLDWDVSVVVVVTTVAGLPEVEVITTADETDVGGDNARVEELEEIEVLIKVEVLDTVWVVNELTISVLTMTAVCTRVVDCNCGAGGADNWFTLGIPTEAIKITKIVIINATANWSWRFKQDLSDA